MIARQAVGSFFMVAVLVCASQVHAQTTPETSAGVTAEHVDGETIAVPNAKPSAALDAEVESEVDASLKDTESALEAELLPVPKEATTGN
jgi:hypothetical protein